MATLVAQAPTRVGLGIKWKKPDFSGWTHEGEEALAAILEANANFRIGPTPEIRRVIGE